jgi:putative redox protein
MNRQNHGSPVKSTLRWTNDVAFVGEPGSGHEIAIDGPPEAGGNNVGARPMELVLTGLGACAAFDVLFILKKSRQKVVNFRAELEAERAESIPKVFKRIHIHFIIEGVGINASAVRRAIHLSTTEYCSATIMLQGSVDITHDFEIVETDGNSAPPN